MNAPRYRINSPAVIYEKFDNELVAIHLDKGTYHSMTGSAADAFPLLSDGATTEGLADALARHYAATPAEIADTLAAFIEQLQKEELVVTVSDPGELRALEIAASSEAAGPRADSVLLPFQPPSLQAYRDLEGLLLLDPVHEVGEEGWPPPSEPTPR